MNHFKPPVALLILCLLAGCTKTGKNGQPSTPEQEKGNGGLSREPDLGQTAKTPIVREKPAKPSPYEPARKVPVPVLKKELSQPTLQYLSDMSEFDVKVAEGRFAKKGNLGYSAGGSNKIRVNGKESPNGIAMHPLSRDGAAASFRIGRSAYRFLSSVALNDSAGTPGSPAGTGRIPTPVTFQVLGDGKLLWESKPLDTARTVEEFQVDVTGVEVLLLRISCPREATNAHAVWLEPRVESQEQSIVVIKDEKVTKPVEAVRPRQVIEKPPQDLGEYINVLRETIPFDIEAFTNKGLKASSYEKDSNSNTFLVVTLNIDPVRLTDKVKGTTELYTQARLTRNTPRPAIPPGTRISASDLGRMTRQAAINGRMMWEKIEMLPANPKERKDNP